MKNAMKSHAIHKDKGKMAKILIWFNGQGSEITKEQFGDKDVKLFNVSFGSSMQVQFEKNEKGLMAVNAVDGYGYNIKNEVYGQYCELYQQIPTDRTFNSDYPENAKHYRSPHLDNPLT